MTDTQAVLERTVVKRLRVSHVATCIHDRLEEVGNPDRFEALLQAPEPVRNLELSLPYVDELQTPADIDLWSMVSETPLTGPLNAAAAKKLRREAVPLRARATLSVKLAAPGPQPPYIDLHVHPFGVVGIATVELGWEDPVPVAEAWSKVAEAEARASKITIGDWTGQTTLGDAAGAAAGRVVTVLAGGDGKQAKVPKYRVATVIDGAIEPVPTVMPADRSSLHVALHYLCGGADPPAPPGNAFVPLWSGGGFRYWPRHLAYMVDKGAAVWAAPRARGAPGATLGQQHRRLTLLLAHLTASIGLIDASRTFESPAFTSWAKTAAYRLARLYGPQRGEQGIEARRYLDQTGFGALIESVLGKQLIANAAYALPSYE